MAKMAVSDRVRGRQVARARFSDFINTYSGARLPLSWVGGMATAKGLATVMNLLAYEGTLQSRTFFSSETLRLSSVPTNKPGDEDRRLMWPIRWGLGFILGDTPHIYGTPPHPRAVGHAGGGAGVAWADPDKQLSVAFLCNSMLGSNDSMDRYLRIGDQVYAAIR
jgi:CubicO group peptidase (beta-lactamase class C family)